jgi:hypothetical protein
MKTDKVSAAAENLRDDIDDIRHSGAEAAEEMSDRFADLEAKLSQGLDDLAQCARELGEVTGRQVRLHPLAAFGVAFLGGIAVARLLRR